MQTQPPALVTNEWTDTSNSINANVRLQNAQSLIRSSQYQLEIVDNVKRSPAGHFTLTNKHPTPPQNKKKTFIA